MGTSPSALLLTCVFAEGSATRGLPPAGRVAVPAGLSASLGPSPAECSSCSPGQACGVGIPQCHMQTSDDSACVAGEGGSGLSQQRAERRAGPPLVLPAMFADGQYQLPRGFLLMCGSSMGPVSGLENPDRGLYLVFQITCAQAVLGPGRPGSHPAPDSGCPLAAPQALLPPGVLPASWLQSEAVVACLETTEPGACCLPWARSSTCPSPSVHL